MRSAVNVIGNVIQIYAAWNGIDVELKNRGNQYVVDIWVKA